MVKDQFTPQDHIGWLISRPMQLSSLDKVAGTAPRFIWCWLLVPTMVKWKLTWMDQMLSWTNWGMMLVAATRSNWCWLLRPPWEEAGATWSAYCPPAQNRIGHIFNFRGAFSTFCHVSVSVEVKNCIIWNRLVTCSSSCRSPFYDFCGGCVGVGVSGYAKGAFFVKDYLIFAEVVFNRSTFDFVQLAANFWLRSASSAQIEFKMRWHL